MAEAAAAATGAIVIPVDEILDLSREEAQIEAADGSLKPAPKENDELPAAAKWRGGAQLAIEAPIAKVWQVASEVCGIPVWMPMIESCEKLDEEASSAFPGNDAGDASSSSTVTGIRRLIRGDILPRIDGEQSWVIERLLEFDSESYFYTYTVDASNIGLEGYTATLQLTDFNEDTTLVSWFYEINPMLDSCEEFMADYMSIFFKSCIKRLEDVCKTGSRTKSSGNKSSSSSSSSSKRSSSSGSKSTSGTKSSSKNGSKNSSEYTASKYL